MHPNESAANGINWDDGYKPYKKLENILKEAVAAFPHLYAYGTWKCKFLEDLTGHTFISLKNFKCPAAEKHKHKYNCGLSCPNFPKSTVQHVARFPITNGCSTTSRRNHMSGVHEKWHVIPINLLQLYKSAVIGQKLVSRYLAMSARRRRTQQQKLPPTVDALTLDTCSFPVQNFSPELDPTRSTAVCIFQLRGQEPLRVWGVISDPKLSNFSQIWWYAQ
jgi:hypothetical protein